MTEEAAAIIAWFLEKYPRGGDGKSYETDARLAQEQLLLLWDARKARPVLPKKPRWPARWGRKRIA